MGGAFNNFLFFCFSSKKLRDILFCKKHNSLPNNLIGRKNKYETASYEDSGTPKKRTIKSQKSERAEEETQNQKKKRKEMSGVSAYLARRAAQKERVRILYRRALKETLNWAVHRHLFYPDVHTNTYIHTYISLGFSITFFN